MRGNYPKKRRLIDFWIVGSAVLFLDQASKYIILKELPFLDKIEIIPGFFNIVHVRNTGIAFSLLAGLREAPIILSIIALCAILFLNVMIWRLRDISRWETISFGLILGGAMGNLTDRLRLGSVIDFLDFYIGNFHWPAFNVADSAITCGALLLSIRLLFANPKPKDG